MNRIFFILLLINGIVLGSSSNKNVEILKKFEGYTHNVTHVGFNKTNNLIFICSFKKIDLFDISNQNNPELKKTINATNNIFFRSAEFSPNGNCLIIILTNQKAHLWDISKIENMKIASAIKETRDFKSVEFSPDSKQLVTLTGDHDAQIKLWNIINLKKPKEISSFAYSFTNPDKPYANYKYINAISFSIDGQYIIVGGTDGTAIILDISKPDNLKITSKLNKHLDGITSVTTVKNPKNLNLIENLKDYLPHDLIDIINQYSDYFYVATISTDKTAQLWDVTDPHNPKHLSSLNHAHFSNSNDTYMPGIESIEFSSNGKHIFTGSLFCPILDFSSGKSITSWNISNSQEPKKIDYCFVGHTASVKAIALNSNGNCLLTGSGDKTAILWKLK